ncbi:glucosamine-6-phosphate deaminase [Arcanobacterium pluranimalium]|uniref:glucosamine-6-phosphate deaminase n=1 Tax=Arcanobacterium pluranimalium TaxID=108028 RepID=UPI0019560594|nr:glucosamine-6-phosphate deaminase [Arcanobacterium pluranimalium]MBM7825861.1 glucosamine-6-phosphate deaminase [Arcanobacterium pluranimalium]
MKVGIFSDPQAVGVEAARVVIDAMNNAQVRNLGVATGSTPLNLYAQLREAFQAGTFTLEGARAFALDEYVNVPADHPERYRNVLRTELVGSDKTGLAEENLFTPDGNDADPVAAAARYDAAISGHGGVELQILGIGSNGHIGFNEPGTALTSRTHVDVLTRQTRDDNARFFDGDIAKVPTHCITQGLGTIMEARSILLIATGSAKKEAVKELVEGAVSSFWPATILQMHQNVTVLVDEAAAELLTRKDFYRDRWETL